MIEVVQGDLAAQEVEAIVRPVRTDFASIDVVGRDLALAAGSELEERLERLGGIPIGGAVLTPAGRLPVSYLIHVVVMSRDEPMTSMSVQRALRNGLRRAADWGIESLALPPLGIGPGAEDPEGSARVLVDILYNHLDEGAKPLDLTVVVGSEFLRDVFERLIGQATYERGTPADAPDWSSDP